jgi:ABC-type nitrate/sulfonate/bicarbonate transport system substrate-binding protein
MRRARVLLVLFVLFVSACAPAPAAPPAADGPEVREVSMRLQWFAQWQFAGYIVALEQGYYAEEGLTVTLNPGGPDLVPLPLVVTGSDTFGSTGADTVLLAREEDIAVVGLATWFQASPVAFMVHRDSGIQTPQDFVGRTVGVFYGDNVETEYRALLGATGVDRSQINEVPGDYSLAPFLERRVEVWPVYATDQPNTVRREGAEVDLIVARDYGVQLMGDVLFTTEEFARNNPRTVAAFVRATLRGWEFAVNNVDAAVEIVANYNPDVDREQLAFEAAETVRLLQYGIGERCLGANDPTAWANQATLLQELGILSAPADLAAALQSDPINAAHAAAGRTCP